ncbi:MAG: hypothetical protein WA280_03300, partial [Xanthobacteraceae bacterium]
SARNFAGCSACDGSARGRDGLAAEDGASDLLARLRRRARVVRDLMRHGVSAVVIPNVVRCGCRLDRKEPDRRDTGSEG